jgi:hypothetical protein
MEPSIMFGNLLEQADDPTDRDDRLTELSEDTGIPTDTLREADEGIRTLIISIQQDKQESIDKAVNENPALGSVMGMLTDDQIAHYLATALLKDPETGPQVVRMLNTLFETTGLYEDAGVADPDPEELHALLVEK